MQTINSITLELHSVQHLELSASEIGVTDSGQVYSVRRIAIHTARGEALQLVLLGDASGIGLVEHHGRAVARAPA